LRARLAVQKLKRADALRGKKRIQIPPKPQRIEHLQKILQCGRLSRLQPRDAAQGNTCAIRNDLL
jgi:hypothetical protein